MQWQSTAAWSFSLCNWQGALCKPKGVHCWIVHLLECAGNLQQNWTQTARWCSQGRYTPSVISFSLLLSCRRQVAVFVLECLLYTWKCWDACMCIWDNERCWLCLPQPRFLSCKTLLLLICQSTSSKKKPRMQRTDLRIFKNRGRYSFAQQSSWALVNQLQT